MSATLHKGESDDAEGLNSLPSGPYLSNALDVRDVADLRYLSHAEADEDNANQIAAQSPSDDSNATTSPALGFGNGTASAADRWGPDGLASARRWPTGYVTRNKALVFIGSPAD
jgi:hypothetical protein